MSDLLFGRVMVLQFGKQGETEFTEVTGLTMTAKGKKTSEGNPNTATITVYNLNEDNRKFFEEEKAIVNLQVGYGETLENILTLCDVTQAKTERQGPDFVTTLECGDGDNAVRETTVDKSFAAGTSIKTMISEATKSFKKTAKVAIGTVEAVKDEVAQNGFSFSGLASTLMDKMTAKQNLEWSIQDNELIILEKNKTTKEDAVVLSPETGLIGRPKAREKGIEFRALLTGRLKPGRRVKIKSETLEGDYRVREMSFDAANRGPNWYADCVALPVG